jgi:hypothetical protein
MNKQHSYSMNMIKKLLPFILAVLIPLLLLGVVGIEIYRQNNIRPQYNFIYSDRYYGANSYSVENGKLTIKQSTFDLYSSTYSRLYLYDAKTNSSRQITDQEAKQLNLLADSVSPDGYTLSDSNVLDYGLFPSLFFGSGRTGVTINKGTVSKRIDILVSPYSFSFIAWVEK